MLRKKLWLKPFFCSATSVNRLKNNVSTFMLRFYTKMNPFFGEEQNPKHFFSSFFFFEHPISQPHNYFNSIGRFENFLGLRKIIPVIVLPNPWTKYGQYRSNWPTPIHIFSQYFPIVRKYMHKLCIYWKKV